MKPAMMGGVTVCTKYDTMQKFGDPIVIVCASNISSSVASKASATPLPTTVEGGESLVS